VEPEQDAVEHDVVAGGAGDLGDGLQSQRTSARRVLGIRDGHRATGRVRLPSFVRNASVRAGRSSGRAPTGGSGWRSSRARNRGKASRSKQMLAVCRRCTARPPSIWRVSSAALQIGHNHPADRPGPGRPIHPRRLADRPRPRPPLNSCSRSAVPPVRRRRFGYPPIGGCVTTRPPGALPAAGVVRSPEHFEGLAGRVDRVGGGAVRGRDFERGGHF